MEIHISIETLKETAKKAGRVGGTFVVSGALTFGGVGGKVICDRPALQRESCSVGVAGGPVQPNNGPIPQSVTVSGTGFATGST